MAKVTSKLQITLPKAIARRYGIVPGDEIEFVPAGDGIRIVHGGTPRDGSYSREERLRLFDAATERQREREQKMNVPARPSRKRDWQRDDLYTRGKPR